MFCPYCGNENQTGAHFCGHCGKSLGAVAPPVPHPPATAAPIKKRFGGGRIVPLLLALLLTAFAVIQAGLALAGKKTTAAVTRYEPRRYVGTYERSYDLTRFEIYYTFTAADGESYAGSAIKKFPKGIVVSSDGTPQTLTVRYLPMLPYISTLDSQVNLLTGILMLVPAALLFWLGVRRKVA